MSAAQKWSVVRNASFRHGGKRVSFEVVDEKGEVMARTESEAMALRVARVPELERMAVVSCAGCRVFVSLAEAEECEGYCLKCEADREQMERENA